MSSDGVISFRPYDVKINDMAPIENTGFGLANALQVIFNASVSTDKYSYTPLVGPNLTVEEAASSSRIYFFTIDKNQKWIYREETPMTQEIGDQKFSNWIDNLCDSPDYATGLHEWNGPGDIKDGKLYCTHTSVSGDSFNCCFKDAVNSNTQVNSSEATTEDVSDRGRYTTCPFDNRDLGSDTCQNIIQSYCFPVLSDNTTLDLKAMAERWDNGGTHDCYYAYQRFLSRRENPNKIYPYFQPIQSINNIENAGDIPKRIFDGLSDNRVDLFADPNSPEYNIMSGVLFKLCKEYPFACNDFLPKLCQSYTPDTIPQKAIPWCGCHMLPTAYSKYTDTYNIPIECSTPCDRQDVIPLTGDDGNIKPKTCSALNLCLIDSLKIDYINSGNLSIQQICGGCADNNSECRCVIEDDTFTVGNNLELSQICGGKSEIVNKGNSIFDDESVKNKFFILLMIVLGLLILGSVLGI